MDYLRAFIVGGGICVIGQILIDKTAITPARILVLFVTAGVILQGIGVYEYLMEFGKAGASVPLPGFGYTLAKGAIEEVDKVGLIGAFTGGVKAASGGIASAIFFGYIMSIIFTAKSKQ
ncbi:MAG: stage V sporulation protein AE [Clostridium sp.]